MIVDRSSLPLLSLITFVPLVGALVIAFIPKDRPRAIRWTALAVALVSFGLSLLMLIGFDPAASGFSYVERVDWIPVFGVQYKVGVDGLAAVLVVLTTTLSWISILASFGPIKERMKEYMISFLILEVGLIGVFVALDLFLFYVFWEGHPRPDVSDPDLGLFEPDLRHTIKFVLYTRRSAAASFLVAMSGHRLHLTRRRRLVDERVRLRVRCGPCRDGRLRQRPPAVRVPGVLPGLRHQGPDVPVPHLAARRPRRGPDRGRSVMLAAIMLKLGAYGFIRFALPLFPDAARTFAPGIIVLSLIAIIYGAIVALVQPDLKKLIAYSSVSHMGFVTLGIFVFQEQGLQGAILQMVNHGLITGALFLLVGVIYERTHDRTIAKLGGLASRTPVYAAAFGFFVFASVGLPGLSGFVGEFLVLVGTFAANPYAAAIATFVMILAAGYLL